MTREWWATAPDRYHLFVSQLTLDECGNGDPDAAKDQIAWEYNALRLADIVSFWFCKETIQPIVLYELGATLMRSMEPDGPKVVIGMEHGYPRAQDVEIQTKLALGKSGNIVHCHELLAALIMDCVLGWDERR